MLMSICPSQKCQIKRNLFNKTEHFNRKDVPHFKFNIGMKI